MNFGSFDFRLKIAVAAAALACAVLQFLLWLPIDGAVSKVTQTIPPLAEPQSFRLNSAGELVGAEGSRPAQSSLVTGWVDRITLVGNRIVVSGWAADIANGQPAERVLIFTVGEPLADFRPNLPRSDVAHSLKIKDALNFGFEAVLPENAASDALKAFAVSRDGKVGTLSINPGARAAP